MPFSFIDRIIQDVSTSSERIIQVIQEGTSMLFDSSSITKTSYATDYGLDEYDGVQHSPLGDIANSVMDELLQGQVIKSYD